jgi:hypothetical protein
VNALIAEGSRYWDAMTYDEAMLANRELRVRYAELTKRNKEQQKE